MKIFERILDQRLREIDRLNINKCGFMKSAGTTGAGTMYATFAARELMERQRDCKQPLHFGFFDLKKAFDRVPHQLIWNALLD